MEDLFLNLKTGQQLKIYPLFKDKLYVNRFFWYINGKQMFTSDFIDFIEFDKLQENSIQRTDRNFIIVEHNNKLSIMKFGQKIRTFIDSNIHKISDFTEKEFILDVNIEQVKGYNSFDKCKLYEYLYEDNNLKMDTFFNSKEYKELIMQFEKYINRLKIENKPEILSFLKDKNIFKDKYRYMLRGLKINEIRQKKIKTTKLQLWNKVALMCDTDIVENIGFSKEGDGSEVHQFMVDGYLFEIKLKDNVK